MPANALTAYITIYDYVGKLTAKYKLQTGTNTTEISGTGLSGIYFYSLEIDGNKIATKKMVVVH
ncbi:MAG: T9SS type A sorting domain-containing protein [Bacteroidia bacterium]|nr:T9SS type A sorting domain-containing protein [Bacteroidia bacterium]